MEVNPNLRAIIDKTNAKIRKRHWKVYEDNIEVIEGYLRLFYQAESMVDHGGFDEEYGIYGIGIFLVDLETHEFYDVPCIEEIPQRISDLVSKK